MFKKSFITHQVYWLAFPIFFVFVLFLAAFSHLFYQYQLDCFYKQLYLYRNIVEERIREEVQNKEAVCTLLKQGYEISYRHVETSSPEELEDSLGFYWCLLKETSLLTKDISFAFIFTAQQQLFMVGREDNSFNLEVNKNFNSLINSQAIAHLQSVNNKGFYLTQPFEHKCRDGKICTQVLCVKTLFDKITGSFLATYGCAVCLSDWSERLLASIDDMKATVICDSKGKILLSRFESQGEALEDFKPLKEDLFLKIVSRLNSKSLIQGSGSLLTVGKLNLTFIPIRINSPEQVFYIFLGFPCFTYWNFIQELFLPLVLFSIVVFFLTFVLIYLFMETFIWRPLHALAAHIINISSTHDFALPLPNVVLIGEISYLFMQFKYLQERLASLLSEMKTLYQQSSLMQDTIFEKNSRVYFDSQEVIERCVKLDSDNEFLNQFLSKFKHRCIDLFELSEQAVLLLARIIERKENFISSWALVNQIADSLSLDVPQDQLDLQINRIKQWTHENSEASLKLNTKELKELQKLFVDFNAGRLELINSFFEMRKSLTFLMDNTAATTAFLQRMEKEVEGLFLVQSQDLQRNRDRIRSLLRNM